MRKLIFAALAASTLVAAPAFAADTAGTFTGARVGVNVGTGGNSPVDFDGQTVGVDVGYDFDLGSAVAGVGLEYQTDLGSNFLDVNETAVVARVGARVGSNALAYLSGGYTRIGLSATPFGGTGADGYRIGAGVEFGRGNGRTSLKIEPRYLDYGNGADAWQTVAGLNFRF